MKKVNIYKRAVVTLLLFSPFLLSAQIDTLKSEMIFNNQLRFSLSANLYDNFRLDNSGVKHLKSLPCLSGELFISYYQHLVNDFGFTIGAGFGIAPYNYYYRIEAPENSIYQTGPYKEDYKYLYDYDFLYIQDLYTFSFSFSKIFNTKKKDKLKNLEVGIKLNNKVAYPYSINTWHTYGIDDSTEVDLFEFSLENSGKRNLFSYFIKLGNINLNKQGNSLNYNIVLHYSPQKIGIGTYKFYELGYDSFGKVQQNINYIGFEFAYGLSFSKRTKLK